MTINGLTFFRPTYFSMEEFKYGHSTAYPDTFKSGKFLNTIILLEVF